MKKSFAIVCAILMVAVSLTGCAKKEIVVNSAEDLTGLKIGCQAGTTGELYVQENVKDAKLVSAKTGMDAAIELKNGSIDAIVLDELPAKEIVSRNPSLKIVDVDLAVEAYAIAVKKGNTELLNKINDSIALIKSNGEYEALINAFMPVDGNIKVPASVKLDTDKVIKLGTNAAFPPFEYLGDNGAVVGFDITMGEKIANHQNANVNVIDMAFDGLIPALQAGTIDFIAAGMSVTPERLKNVDFSDPYYESKQVVIVRK